MTTTQFPEWLQQMSEIAGGAAAEWPPVRIGTARTVTFTIATDAFFGDWTAGTFAMQAKASPGADTIIATFECETGTPAGGTTPVTIALPVAAQSTIPDPLDSGVGELFYDIIYTVGASDPVLVAAGRIPVLAGITE